MKAILLFAIILAVAYCVPIKIDDTDAAIEFGKFVQKYNKQYFAADEQAYRFRVFKQNFNFIQTHNNKNLGFKVALNEFADLTNAEFRNKFLGTRSKLIRKGARHVPKVGVELPTTVDWRTQGAVTAVKNQGQCGSCWSFSTTGSVEGAWFLKNKKLVSLSEQNLVDCSGSFGNQGCNGGLMDDAFQYIIKNGIEAEAAYPYTARDGRCRFDKSKVVVNITSYHDVAEGSESDLLSAVAQQPTSVAIDASHLSFQFYSSGVYYESSCSTTELDHGVLAVGYGTDSGKDYWLVKNSWGASWGLSGYIKMTRNNKNNCGIATSASYPIV